MEVMWTQMEVVVDEGAGGDLAELRRAAEKLSGDVQIRTVSYRDVPTWVFVVSIALGPIGVGFGEELGRSAAVRLASAVGRLRAARQDSDGPLTLKDKKTGTSIVIPQEMAGSAWTLLGLVDLSSGDVFVWDSSSETWVTE